MVVWHVTTLKKLNKYLKSGKITPPVRAWETIEQAERMSRSTGRRIILVHWDGHKVVFGGRTERAQIQAPLVNALNRMFGGVENEELFEQKFGDSDVILFGEGYGPGIQRGGAYRKDVSFILFDVLIGGVFLRRKDVEDIARTFGIDAVPIVGEGTLDEAVAYIQTRPKSTIGTADMEGVVARPKTELKDRLGRRVIVKIKACDHCV